MRHKNKENKGPIHYRPDVPHVVQTCIFDFSGGYFVRKSLRNVFTVKDHGRRIFVGGGTSEKSLQRQKQHVKRERGKYLQKKNNRRNRGEVSIIRIRR